MNRNLFYEVGDKIEDKIFQTDSWCLTEIYQARGSPDILGLRSVVYIKLRSG